MENSDYLEIISPFLIFLWNGSWKYAPKEKSPISANVMLVSTQISYYKDLFTHKDINTYINGVV